MLPSMRHFLRFIDADKKFNTFGFIQKVGAFYLLTVLGTEAGVSSKELPSSLTLRSEKDVSLIPPTP